jgi:hypothetical protein
VDKLSLNKIIGLLFFLVSFSVYSQDQEVYFAGVAITGSVGSLEDSHPYVQEVLFKSNPIEINKLFTRSFREKPPTNFELIFDDLGRLDGTTSPIAFAAAIDRETVTIENIAGDYKVLIEVAAQALFFDFRERQTLFTYPITLQHVEIFQSEPEAKEIEYLFRNMLMGESETSFVPVLVDRLSSVTLPNAATRRIQLVELTSSSAINDKFEQFSTFLQTGVIGHEFSKIFSYEQNLAMLPFSNGQAIGGAMAARFASGDVFNLKIPAPDYEITVNIDDLRGRRIQETRAFRQELFGAFFHINVKEPLSGRIYFDQSLRQGATKTIPATQGSFDEFAAYYETILLGFSSFARSLDGRGEDWRREQTGGRELSNQLKELQELINLCR